MKRLFLLVVVALILPAAYSHAGDTSGYQTAKHLDLRREGTGAGAARAQGFFCLSVEIGDMAYLVHQESRWRWSYEPTDFVVGDPVEVKIRGNDMYLKRPKGADFRTYIVRRERIAPDKKPMTCGLPIATSN